MSARRLASRCAFAGITLAVVGGLVARSTGVAEVIGLVALGNGVGLIVAAIFIAIDRNPLRRR